MRATYYEGADTLQRDRLPPGRPNLIYRPNLPTGAGALTGAGVIAVVLLALLFTLAIRLSGFLVATPVMTLFIISGPIAAIVLLILRYPPRVVILAAFAGGGVWLVLAFLHVSSSPRLLYFAGLGPVLLIVLWAADAITLHYLHWMAAHPQFSASKYSRSRRVWRHRFGFRPYRRAAFAILAAVGFGALVWLFPIPSSSPQPLYGAGVVLSVTMILAVLAVGTLVFQPRTARPGFWFLQPLINWFTYAPHPFAPGVLRIPVEPFACTSALSRKAITAAVLFLLTAAVASTACYFPVSMAISSKWLAMAEVPADQAPKALSPSEVASRLTPQQQTYFDRLPYQYRSRYLDVVAREQHLVALKSARQTAQSQLIAYINSSPEAWFPVLARQVAASSTFVLWTLFFSLALSTICPIIIFLSIVIMVSHPMVVRAESRLATRLRYPTPWDGHVARVQGSNHQIEKESLFVGTHATADYPVLLHRGILLEHAHILGDSGSGKTALALAPMTAQLIRMAGRDAKRPASAQNPHSSIVIIDLKGDLALFHGARIEAERAGLPFKWYTNSLHCSTFVFNPFTQSHFSQLTVNQRTEILVDALALHHGEGYGRSYFSRVNRRVLSRMLRAYGKSVQSFRDLYGFALKPTTLGQRFKLTPREQEDAGELFATLETLCSFDALNETSRECLSKQIDMQSVATSPQVVYFYLQSALESASVREIGKLALYCLLSAAAKRDSAEHLVYLFIDEFQQIVSENLELILRQARSMGIAAILANQTISDLETPYANLIPTVQGNTRFKQFFAATDLKQQEALTRASGDTIDYIQHWANNGSLDPRQESETVQPRLNRNDIIRVTDDPNLCVMHVPRGKGYTQMAGFSFVARSDFHISREDYAKRQHMPWPEEVPGTFTPNSEWVYEPGRGNAKARSARERCPPPTADLFQEPSPVSGNRTKPRIPQPVGPTSSSPSRASSGVRPGPGDQCEFAPSAATAVPHLSATPSVTAPVPEAEPEPSGVSQSPTTPHQVPSSPSPSISEPSSADSTSSDLSPSDSLPVTESPPAVPPEPEMQDPSIPEPPPLNALSLLEGKISRLDAMRRQRETPHQKVDAKPQQQTEPGHEQPLAPQP